MRLIYYIIILTLLTACGDELKESKPEPPAQSFKMINEVKNEAIEKKSSGIEIADRKEVAKATTTTDSSNILPSVDPLELNGKIVISGSQVVLPLSRSIAERFIDDGFPGEVNMSGLTTSKGIKLLCQGKVDIVNATRTPATEELEGCAKSGREPIGFPVAYDAVTLVVSSRNQFLPETLTQEQLRKIFTAKQWSDVNPSWPKQEIKRVFPSAPGNRGGFDLMANYLGLENGGKELAKDPDTLFYDFVEQLHSRALIDPNMLGMLEYASYSQNKDILKAIAINGIKPSEPNYPVTRSLYIYVDAKQVKQRPELQGFLNYYFTYVNQDLNKLGFFGVNSTQLNASKNKLLQMTAVLK